MTVQAGIWALFLLAVSSCASAPGHVLHFPALAGVDPREEIYWIGAEGGDCASQAARDLLGMLQQRADVRVAPDADAFSTITVSIEEGVCQSLRDGERFELGLRLHVVDENGATLVDEYLRYTRFADKPDPNAEFKSWAMRSGGGFEEGRRSAREVAFYVARRDLMRWLLPQRRRVRFLEMPECQLELPAENERSAAKWDSTLTELVSCEAALGPGPARARVRYNLAMLMFSRGDREGALEIVRNAKDDDSNLTERLGVLLARYAGMGD